MNGYVILCCIVGVLGLLALLVMIPRLLSSFWKNRGIPSLFNNPSGNNQNTNASPGTITPQYDDPNIESHGGFGRQSTPNLPRPSSGSETERSRGANDPNIQSQGSFGRDKD